VAELKVETWSIDRLIPYARNPRRNDEQVDRMASAIREFGFRIPIVAKSDGSVVDGHLRLKAAQKLGLTEVPVALADELTDAQVKAFRILANKSANWAEWDFDLLKLEVQELKDMEFDLDLTGFEVGELEALEGADYGHIDGLMEEAMGSGAAYNEESDIFSVSFNFQRDQKGMIEDFLKKKTKDYVVEMIIREAEKTWQE